MHRDFNEIVFCQLPAMSYWFENKSDENVAVLAGFLAPTSDKRYYHNQYIELTLGLVFFLTVYLFDGFPLCQLAVSISRFAQKSKHLSGIYTKNYANTISGAVACYFYCRRWRPCCYSVSHQFRQTRVYHTNYSVFHKPYMQEMCVTSVIAPLTHNPQFKMVNVGTLTNGIDGRIRRWITKGSDRNSNFLRPVQNASMIWFFICSRCGCHSSPL